MELLLKWTIYKFEGTTWSRWRPYRTTLVVLIKCLNYFYNFTHFDAKESLSDRLLSTLHNLCNERFPLLEVKYLPLGPSCCSASSLSPRLSFQLLCRETMAAAAAAAAAAGGSSGQHKRYISKTAPPLTLYFFCPRPSPHRESWSRFCASGRREFSSITYYTNCVKAQCTVLYFWHMKKKPGKIQRSHKINFSLPSTWGWTGGGMVAAVDYYLTSFLSMPL